MGDHKKKNPLEEQLKSIIKKKSEENAALNKLLEQLENSKEDQGIEEQLSQDSKSKKNIK